MSDKVEFPGGWAKLRDPRDVTERNRRPLAKVQRALLGSNIGDVLVEQQEQGAEVDEQELAKLLRPHIADDAMDLFEQADELLMFALIEEWSIETPVTVDAIRDLPGRTYDLLRDACRPLLNAVLGAEDESALGDPASPTTPSSG